MTRSDRATISRRSLFLAPLPFLLARPAAAFSPAAAALFIKQTGDRFIAVLDSSAPLAEKQQQFQAIIDRSVDVDGVGRFVLGRFWQIATPEQRQEYLSLFRQLIVYNFTSRVSQYRGTTFTIDGTEEPDPGEVYVAVTVYVPGSAPTKAEWVVALNGPRPLITDLIIAGTSLRVTERSDYTSVITRNNVEIAPLLAAMKRQLSQLKASG